MTRASGGIDMGLRDALTGRSAEARAEVVVNCAGPRVDKVLARANMSAQPQLVRGSKGSHLLVRRYSGAPDTGVHYEARADGRAVLVMPIGDCCLIGATDTFVDGDPAATITSSRIPRSRDCSAWSAAS